MPRTDQQSTEQQIRIEAALLAWGQCLRENGLQGAMGCAHLAVEAADAFIAQLRNSEQQS